MYDSNQPFDDNQHDYNLGANNQFFGRRDDENNAFAQNAEALQFNQNAGINEF